MKLIFILFPLLCHSQQWTEIGIKLGVASYMGDINESKLFYNPRLSKTLLYKLNVNDRYSAKLSFTNAQITGSDTDFENPLQNNRQNSFQTGVWDVVLQTEFNFLSFNPLEIDKKPISPYVSMGIGGIFITSIGKPVLAVPFGVGIKAKVYNRFAIGSELTFRKTFNDEMDGIINLSTGKNHSFLHNNDWLSFLSFVVTYNISNVRIDCPAYDK